MADYRKVRASTWRSWLNGLPEEIYDKRDTAHIVRLMDALCGNGGVNSMRKSLLLKRLQTSLYETRYGDLDTVYSAIFDLPRLRSEQYEYREDALLLWSEIQEMNIKDAHYRERIWNYMLSFQYGGTLKGLQLAATAAVGIPCEVVDGCIYFSSTGIPQSEQGSASGLPLNFDGTVDFNGVTIVVMMHGRLTEEQQYNLSTITGRLRPVDVHYTFMTVDELMRMLALHDIDDEVVNPMSVEASSRWWRVVRTVTGRPDWVNSGSDDDWVEANVAKEAPQQLLVNSQEGEYDFTQMVKSAKASSEHVGRYGSKIRSIFPSFDVLGAEMPKPARNAVSQASSRNVASGYYGEGLVIDGAYPSSYSSRLTSFFSEEGRSRRFWSSDERDGSEWVEVELKRTVPINYVSMGVFRKPVKVKVFFSSYADEDGNRAWVPARDSAGRQLTYTNPEWGGGNEEVAIVDFFPLKAMADAVRIEFERLDVPYYTEISTDSYEEDSFKFSVELADLSIKYVVRLEEDFLPTTYEDMFGNRVDTSIETMDAEHAIDGDSDTFWLSQPNLGESAVEYLVLKLSDEPVRVNFMDVEAVYAGCQMNVYSSDDVEPVEWVPYPQVYSLRSGRYELPMRKVTHIKLEFTTLCATPYETNVPKVFVETRRFPWDVRDYCDRRFGSDYEISKNQALLMSQNEVFYDEGSVKNRLGVDDEYIPEDRTSASFYSSASRPAILSDNTMYRSRQDSPLVEFYGDDLAREIYMEQAPYAESFGGPSPAYRFNETCEHVYEVDKFERTDNLAYVVGIKDVSFGFSGRTLTLGVDDAVFMYMQDPRFVSNNDGWEFVNGERARVSSESLNSLETVDVQSVYPFRSFEFSVNQKPPVEKFEYPSNMVEEWHGLGSDVESVDFGTNGTVMFMTNSSAGNGIESEPKLTRSMAIANVQVDVFPTISGQWVLECGDLFGESVFAASYDLPAGKWSTVGMNFVPMPGGDWWDRDYPYRVRIPLVGPLAKGQAVFVPVIDFEALLDDGMIDSNFDRLRLVYFNGVNVREIDVDITDNMELWFKVEQDLPTGAEANGAYDFDRDVFVGSYYLYFGSRSGVLPDEDDLPMRDYRKVFEPVPYSLVGMEIDDGTSFLNVNEMALFDDKFYLPDSGFASFEITLADDMVRVPDGEQGTAEIRFILDYEDGDKKMQVYMYERQLVFVIVDSDGFESSFVSLDEGLLSADVKSYVIIEWGAKGSAPVMEVDPEDPTSTAVNPANRNRRAMRMFIDSSTELECIPNVYDEKHYIDSDKVY